MFDYIKRRIKVQLNTIYLVMYQEGGQSVPREIFNSYFYWTAWLSKVINQFLYDYYDGQDKFYILKFKRK